MSIVKSSSTAQPARNPKRSPRPRITKYCPPPATGYAAASSVYARPTQTYTSPANKNATFDAPAAAPNTRPSATKISAPTSAYPQEYDPHGVTERRSESFAEDTARIC